MIRVCSLQSADAAQLFTTGSACQGLFPMIYLHLEMYAGDFFLTVRIPFCSDILFKPKKGPKGAMRRAWKNMLPDRILIFCMYANFHTFVTHMLNYPSSPVTSVLPCSVTEFCEPFLQETWDRKETTNSCKESYHLSWSQCAENVSSCTHGTRYAWPKRGTGPLVAGANPLAASTGCKRPESVLLF